VRHFTDLLISRDCSIKQAIKAIDKGAQKIVFIVNKENILLGSISDGDIRRWILNQGDLEDSIGKVYNNNPKYAHESHSKEENKSKFKQYSISVLPVINSRKEVIDVISRDQYFGEEEEVVTQIDLPVVIMAGGKGTRMDPFTRILPKPLIPIGDKAMIEVIMDEYAKYGMKNFYISINHKGKMIKAFLDDHDSDYSFSFLNENKPLGTAGALKYMENKTESPFFVSNCDIIIKDDYAKIFEFHKKDNYDLTIVVSMQHHIIPYGVCEIENGGELKSITEKPQYDFLVNTGMYLLNPTILKYIPENEFFHITHLIEKLKQKGFKIGVYLVSGNAYVDVGQWDEYKKAINKLQDE